MPCALFQATYCQRQQDSTQARLAIFHATLTPVSRAAGHSAVGAAAYRAGLRLTDERTGDLHDFSRKAGVLDARMVVPADAPAWTTDIGKVWNAIEAAEVRGNARVGRDFVVALPHELSETARADLARQIAGDIVARYGCVVLAALHAPDARGDQRNFHAHLLMSTRQLGPDGFAQKVRVLDDRQQGPKELAALRSLVADRTNEALTNAGLQTHVDSRSLAARARAAAARGDVEAVADLVREPHRHLGRAATAALRRGERGPKAEENLNISHHNMAFTAASRARAAELWNQQSRAATARPLSLPGARLPSPAKVRIAVAGARGAVEVGRSATGRDARLLNAQATAVQKSLRASAANAALYSAGLQDTARSCDDSLKGYIAALRYSAASAEALRRYLQDAGAMAAVRRALDAREAWEAARATQGAARTARGKAAVKTAQAQRAADEGAKAAPPVWRALSRRQWAEKRRAQRAAVAAAEHGEQGANRAVAQAGSAVAETRRAWEAAEAERRRLVPLPDDGPAQGPFPTPAPDVAPRAPADLVVAGASAAMPSPPRRRPRL